MVDMKTEAETIPWWKPKPKSLTGKLFWLTVLVAGFTFAISAVQARLRLPQALKHLGEDAA